MRKPDQGLQKCCFAEWLRVQKVLSTYRSILWLAHKVSSPLCAGCIYFQFCAKSLFARVRFKSLLPCQDLASTSASSTGLKTVVEVHGKLESCCYLLNIPAVCKCVSSVDLLKCCHTEMEDQTGCLTQSQYIDTGPTSPSTDPLTPGIWQGSH